MATSKLLSPEDIETLTAIVLTARQRKNMSSDEMRRFHQMIFGLAKRAPDDKPGMDAWFAEAEALRDQINQEHPE